MSRHRTPLAKAQLTGAAKKHPERYKGRTEPDGGPILGQPPRHFSAAQKKIWAKFQAELPWLTEADRAIVEVTAITRALIEAGCDGATAALLREHRQQLSSLGATPVTRSNVAQQPAQDEDDRFAQFHQRN